jgi:hypothetical protein
LRPDPVAGEQALISVPQYDDSRKLAHHQIACRATGRAFVEIVELSVANFGTVSQLPLDEIPYHQTHQENESQGIGPRGLFQKGVVGNQGFFEKGEILGRGFFSVKMLKSIGAG